MADDPALDLDDEDLDDELDVEEEGPATSGPQSSAGPSTSSGAQGHGYSVDEARLILRHRLKDLLGCALSQHEFLRAHELDPDFDELEASLDPLHFAIKATTGVGKSAISRQEIAGYYIPEAKARKLPHRVLITVPTHKLANEARGRMPAGVTTAIWQGRGGIHLESNEPMCGNLDAVETALKIGANVEETACKSGEVYCPLFKGCRYQQQKAVARTADIVYCAHEALFQAPSIGKRFGLVLIDESFWEDGVMTTSHLAIASLADELTQHPVRFKGVTQVDAWTDQLRGIIRQLQSALERMPEGYVRRQPLIDVGLDKPATTGGDSPCTAAGKLEWLRKTDPELGPDASAEERKQAVEKFGYMKQLRRRHRMWRTLHELVAGSDDSTGRLRIETLKTENGPVRCLQLLGHKNIVERLAKLPLDIVKYFLPKCELAGDLTVAAPHLKVFQVIGDKLSVGKSSLQALKPGKRSPDEETRVERKRARLVGICRHLMKGRRGLIVSYQSIEDDFKGIDNVETAHFGNFTGIDAWGDVETLIVIGRPFPKSDDIQNMAAAITGRPIITGAPLLQECKVVNGPHAGRIIKRRVYNTAEAEMIRVAVTETAIVQAIGRTRAVNRSPTDPVEVFLVLGDTILPDLDIDEVIDITDIEPSAVDLMIERGLVPKFPTDAAKLYPDLFPSRKAATKAYLRAGLRLELGPAGLRLETFPNKKSLIRPSLQPPCVALCFQPSGRGQLRRFCIVDLVKVPDPRAALEAAWKRPMAWFEVVKAEDEVMREEPEAPANDLAAE